MNFFFLSLLFLLWVGLSFAILALVFAVLVLLLFLDVEALAREVKDCDGSAAFFVDFLDHIINKRLIHAVSELGECVTQLVDLQLSVLVSVKQLHSFDELVDSVRLAKQIVSNFEQVRLLYNVLFVSIVLFRVGFQL